MEESLDVNLIVQSFSDRINQLTNENILKDAYIKHLKNTIEELTALLNGKDITDE